MTKSLLGLTAVLSLFLALAGCRGERVTIVTTTSLDNSGLLEEILPHFEAEHGIRTRIVAVGTGAAIQMGRLGETDILLVHDPALEQEFMDEGFGALRQTIVYNDFLIVGPDALPAKTLADALGLIHGNLTFYSRGDDSGTHARELYLWETFGYDIDGFGGWYKETGQGMGSTMNMASTTAGYTLTDRGTYLAMRANLHIGVAYENPEDEGLHNLYSIIKVSSEIRGGDGEAARVFFDWFTSAATVNMIGEYRVDGERLFIPLEE